MGTRRVEIGERQIDAAHFNVREHCSDICYNTHIDFGFPIVLPSAKFHQDDDRDEEDQKALVSLHRSTFRLPEVFEVFVSSFLGWMCLRMTINGLSVGMYGYGDII